MTLLFDQNISHRIIPYIVSVFPRANHVKFLGLHNADDRPIFMFAREHNFDAIVTMDDDFLKLLNLLSAPPKVIWVRTGNCGTSELASLLIQRSAQIQKFVDSKGLDVYEILKR